MSRIYFFIVEGTRALRRNVAPSVAAIVTVVLTVVLLGVFIPVLYATQDTTNDVRNRLELSVFLKVGSSQAQIDSAEARIKQLPHVTTVSYVSPEEAIPVVRERLGSNGDILDAVHGNPLPPAFQLKVDDPDNLSLVAGSLVPPGPDGKPNPISPSIQDVSYAKADTQKILSLTTAVTVLLIAIMSLLIIASLLLVGNTIRLSIYARRREIEVMKLVGATNWFIRWPFITEGFLVGLIGSGLALGLLAVGKLVVIDPIGKDFHVLDGLNTISFVPLILLLLGSAMAVSAIGSGFTLRRFLRV